MKIHKTEEDIKELKNDIKKLDKDMNYIIRCNEKRNKHLIEEEVKDLEFMD